MQQWKKLAFGVALATFGLVAAAKAQDYTSLPRKETLIVENPEGTIKNPGWFNIWVNGGGGVSTGLQQLTMDTLWYIDPEKGLGGSAWDNSLAADKPQYNDDFTQMTVKLRKGIYWSDGVEFTADDVVYTVKTQMDHPGMVWSAAFSVQVASVEATDPYTVVFKLKKPNSRFHAIFTVRWNGAWIMPKHVFEKVADPVRYDNANPVSLGAYKLKAYDPQGKWYTWEKRDDWQRTSLARFGEPAPKYVSYVDPGPPDKRTIAQIEHNLDIIHDNTPEGMFTLKEKSKTVESWFPGFPFAHPDPTLPAVIFNNQDPLFQNADVRWALALLIDIKAVDMASYRGAATLSALGVPPTAIAMTDYQAPMQDWLKNFEIDTGKRKIKPYDPTVGQQIADLLRKQPKFKDQIPTDPAGIRSAAQAAEVQRSDSDRSGRHQCCLRLWLVEARSAGRCGAFGKGRLQEGGWQMDDARWAALQDPSDGRRRHPLGLHPRRDPDCPAMGGLRHRLQGCTHHKPLASGTAARQLSGCHRLERRDLGR